MRRLRSSPLQSLPLHGLVVGDAIAVYSYAERQWRSAVIAAAAGDHECEVTYEDGGGAREWVSLEKVRYRTRRGTKETASRARSKRVVEIVDGGSGGEETEESGSEESNNGVSYNGIFSSGEKSKSEEIKHRASNDNDKKIAPRRRSKRLQKRLRFEDILSGEESETEEIKQWSSDEDERKLAPCRRSKRLQKKLRVKIILNNDEESEVEKISQRVSDDDDRKLVPRRRSKRLQGELRDEEVSNERHSQSSWSHMLPACSTSDDEFLGNAVKAGIRSSSELLCLVCKSGVASNLFIQCANGGCVHIFHSFCLDPPLQNIERSWTCPICQVYQVPSFRATKEEQCWMKKIQSIVGHRRVILPDSEFQYQFLIKWVSLSHHHDCWVPLEWLYIFDRARLCSYRRKYPLQETDSIDQRNPAWLKVDRVIACRVKYNCNDSCDIWSILQAKEDYGDFEFLVKWKELDYCEATWESSCTDDFLAAVSEFVERHQRASKKAENHSPTSPFCQIGTVPEVMHNSALYGYQLQGLQWILNNFKARRNVILADEMGLGKTVQVVCFLHQIMEEKSTIYPALVIAPKSILLQWEKEFCCWARGLNVVIYQGDKASRECIQVHEMYSSEGNTLFDALVTSYELVQLDSMVLRKFKWSTIVIDEAHRMKKLDCNLATCLKQYRSEFRLLLTGTPLQNTLLELFALLHFLDPDEFSDPKAEAETIETGLRHSYSKTKVAQIHELLKPRMLRRMKSDVLPESIPTKKWVEVPCALTDSQRQLYKNILEKNYLKLNKEIQSGKKISLNCILMALRKCCNHPYLFPGQEVYQQSEESNFLSLVAASGKLQLLEKLLPRLKERGNRVVIFSQMTKMLDILEDFLSFLGFTYSRIDGQTSLSDRQQRIKEYNSVDSETFIFLMSTRAGGLGVDLPGADRVIIYDPDFNPFMDLQAQSRAHRIGQTRPVVVYQLITKCSVEEKILTKSKQKLAIENIVMNSSKKPSADELHSILLNGARTIIDRRKVHATSIHYDELAIENLLKLDPAPGEKCSSDDNGYLGSIVSFSHGVENEEPPRSPEARDWKDILGPVAKETTLDDLGRGKRRKKIINYACEDNSDSDDMYAPESYLTTGSSSSDYESDSFEPEVVSEKI